MTLVLGLESSCDETAVALVADGHQVLAERVASQAADFADWGGVVPELAARGHVGWLPGLAEQVLNEAGLGPAAIDAVAVAAWPGLIGSLLCGVSCAKMLAARWRRPLIAVDHVQAHLAAVHLGRTRLTYPLVGLVASGGHSHLYLAQGPGQLQGLGGTIDDAAGEAYDKAAVILGLGYPGGPLIDHRAAHGEARHLRLPRPFLHDDSLRFSFAGLKTALLYAVRGPQGRAPLNLNEDQLDNVCASFQAAMVECLAGKLLLAAQHCKVNTVALGGGVACNSGLRARLSDDCAARGLELLLPHSRHCADNAAMVAALACFLHERGQHSNLDLVPQPSGSREIP